MIDMLKTFVFFWGVVSAVAFFTNIYVYGCYILNQIIDQVSKEERAKNKELFWTKNIKKFTVIMFFITIFLLCIWLAL